MAYSTMSAIKLKPTADETKIISGENTSGSEVYSVDTSGNIVAVGVTASGPITGTSVATTGAITQDVLQAATHGAGAIGTYAAPKTYIRTVNGEIVTTIKVDLTGLASVNTSDDVIGLAAGGAAYLLQYIAATHGIVYKIEMSCIETPAGGGTDINVVSNASGVLAWDGAGGTTYGINGGAQAAGMTVQNLVSGLTTTHYLYLTIGTGSAGTYTAGQLIIKLFGHAAL
jgi:hypothetical protein